jgi:hypothetical protein
MCNVDCKCRLADAGRSCDDGYDDRTWPLDRLAQEQAS